MAYFSFNKLRSIIRGHKTLSESLITKRYICAIIVVYKISCKECNTSYIGQTSKQLKTRITEHRNHINRNTIIPSVITNHRIDYNHEFNWDDIKILDESFLSKRLLSEIFVHKLTILICNRTLMVFIIRIFNKKVVNNALTVLAQLHYLSLTSISVKTTCYFLYSSSINLIALWTCIL